MPCTVSSVVSGIIDEERKIKHRKFADKVEEILTKPEKIKLKLKSDSVDMAYPPVIQSGGVYDLKSVSHSFLQEFDSIPVFARPARRQVEFGHIKQECSESCICSNSCIHQLAGPS